MSLAIRSRLRDARYALPGLIERNVRGQDVDAAIRACAALESKGYATTLGYFHRGSESAHEVAEVSGKLATGLAKAGLDSLVAVKGNALDCDQCLLDPLGAKGVPLVFDAMTPAHAARILDLAAAYAAGIALPARWRRSAQDAARLRDGPCRIRLVKGEWADPDADTPDIAGAYVDLSRQLAGRSAMVGVATHDPDLAEAALSVLLAAGTPCELEQLRGLPRRRTMAVAKRLGVKVRLYYPFGPGWWPYAIDKALSRPYLPIWALKDALGR